MPDPAPEFARPLVMGRVGPAGRTETLAATPAECAALARRFGILAIDRLEATLRLLPAPEGAVDATGALVAEVVQACVVSLDPVPQRVEAPLEFRFLPEGAEPGDGPEDPDEIETTGGIADLGEAVAEALALALDPYPRVPGAVMPDAAAEAPSGAFAALAALSRRRD